MLGSLTLETNIFPVLRHFPTKKYRRREKMLENINTVLGKINDFVWGVPLIVLILAAGIFLTIRLKGIQVTKLGKGFKLMFAKVEQDGHGEISSFGALCTALSATIGTGNIVGVATAIVTGGPGALFWMWIAALFGTATKFSECMLAVKYRTIAEDGHVVGGPFYYIENGMGKNWKWLAKIFAFFGVCVGLFSIGTFTQVNGISSAVKNFFDPDTKHVAFKLFGIEYSWTIVISGIILTICVGLVIIGGLKRITNVAQVIVPFMAILYVITALLVIIFNIDKVPGAFKEIIEGAFGLKAAAGGTLGAIIVAMQKGIARGIFSNEAGLGSAPIAAAAAKSNEPVEQGLVSMLGTFIDTIVICTLTGLTIVIAGSWNIGLEGVAVTTHAFQTCLPFPSVVASLLLMVWLGSTALSVIMIFLTASLVLASLAQWRWKTQTFPDVEEIKRSVLESSDWKKLTIEYYQINQWIDLVAKIQKEKARLNNKRVKLIMASMICLYCSIASILLSFIIAVAKLI